MLERWNLVHSLFEFFLQTIHISVIQSEGFSDAGAGRACLAALPGRILKIAAHGFLNLLTSAQQPKNDEKRHHGRHEIGIGYLPSAAVLVIVTSHNFADDDDGARRLSFHAAASVVEAPGCFLQALSISWKVGRTG